MRRGRMYKKIPDRYIKITEELGGEQMEIVVSGEDSYRMFEHIILKRDELNDIRILIIPPMWTKAIKKRLLGGEE